MSLVNESTDDIAPGLVFAYRQARYVVDLPGASCVLRVHAASAALGALMHERNMTTAAFLTAANPRSMPLASTDNARAQRALESDVAALGCPVLHGRGEDPSGGWAAEPSLLALGISLGKAAELAMRYQQNAFLWIASPEAFCTLRLLRALSAPSDRELAAWRGTLPPDEASAAREHPRAELAWLMSVPADERRHWLLPQQWDMNVPWPLARPDGAVMHAGTELDRQFRLAAAGLGPMLIG